MGAFSCLQTLFLSQNMCQEVFVLKENKMSADQINSVAKGIEWMERSKPSVAARSDKQKTSNQNGVNPQGVAYPPHARDCGSAHPMQGTNHDDLYEWCMEHET